MPEYFKIGKFVASHGLQGHLILVHSLGKKTSFKGLEAIFIEEAKDQFIPYFVERTSLKSETETLLKLEGFDSKESARRVTSKEVWLAENDFKKFAPKAAPIALLGYDLIDGDKNLGPILEVIEQPHQVLCVIMHKDKEALIPLHEESLKKVDKKNRKVFVDLPDGLLEIYE